MANIKAEQKRGRIDSCMNFLCQWINSQGQFRTIASCCGHGKYRPTIVVHDLGEDLIIEYFTGTVLKYRNKNGHINRRFYARDAEGVYYLLDLGPFEMRFLPEYFNEHYRKRSE